MQGPDYNVVELQDRLRLVSAVTRRFAEATTDYRRLLDSVAFSLAESIHDSCIVFLLDEERESLGVVAMHSPDARALELLRQAYAERRLQLAEQPGLRHVVTSGQALLVPRLADRPETNPERRRWESQLGLHSVLVVPLSVQGRPIGVLSLSRFLPESPPFSESELELAQSLADHAALAIENARLFAEAAEARRVAEEARETVRRAEAARQQLIETSPHPRYVVDAVSLKILQGNAAALELYGYSREEFLLLSLDDLRHPDDQPRLQGMLQAAGEDHTIGLAKHRRKDGSIIYVEGGSQVSMLDGRPARFVLLSDQTKRVQAERERDASEQRLRRTLDDMKEGYTIMGRDLRYLYVNRAGAEQTHLSREQLLGHTPGELYPGFDGSPIDRALRRAVETGEPQRVENEFQHSDGETGYFDLRIQPVPEGLVVLSIDQTERRRAETRRDSLEEQLRQAQKMEAVGRLAGGIAHDFNNVLSVILGYTEDLLRDAPLGDRRQDVEEIHVAGTRAAALTRQLLMFSRQQMLEPKVLDLNAVLAEMDRMLERALGEGIELVQLPGRGLGRVRADRSSIEQVIMNLVVNARDAMPNGGRVTIETANIVADEAFVRQHLDSKPGPYVLLSVTDTGVGIDPPTRARIFEPFFSTKPREQGTGLGLSTVFGIVQRSGGGIWVYSEVGRGSSFKVYLPRIDAALDASRSSAPPAEADGTETVLLVEDEHAVRNVARRILERRGYTVLAPETTEEAVSLCERHSGPIDLLLTDVVMPGVNGAELAARLSTIRPGLRVLYMSGYTDGTISSHQVLEQDASSFVQKPFSAELLARMVRGTLDVDGRLEAEP
jgi:PAS domain S-box-containing protein